MAFPLVPVLLGTGVVAILALLAAGKPKPVPSPIPERENPDEPTDPDRPIIPDQFPPTQQTACVIASSGLNLRSAPDENSPKVGTKIPRRERVAIIDPTTAAPTPAAPQGWWNVRTQDGRVGWMSAEFLFFGSDKECAMTEEEWRAHIERLQDKEYPEYQTDFSGIGACGPAPYRPGWSWYTPNANIGAPLGRQFPKGYGGPSSLILNQRLPGESYPDFLRRRANMLWDRWRAARARGATPAVVQALWTQYANAEQDAVNPTQLRPSGPAGSPPPSGSPLPPPISGGAQFSGMAGATVTCVAPSGCRLRTAPSNAAISSLVVENGARLAVVQRMRGPKNELSSPSLGGWSRVRYHDRATGRMYDGWLPSEWLV